MNIFLVSTSVEGASHTYLCLSWLAKAYCVYMGEWLQLHTRYSSVIVAMSNPLVRVSACEFFYW